MASFGGDESLLKDEKYLPVIVRYFNKNKKPVYGQWKYQILCHPLNNDLPLHSLKPIDDLRVRFQKRQNINSFKYSDSARFTVGGQYYNYQYYKQHIILLCTHLFVF